MINKNCVNSGGNFVERRDINYRWIPTVRKEEVLPLVHSFHFYKRILSAVKFLWNSRMLKANLLLFSSSYLVPVRSESYNCQVQGKTNATLPFYNNRKSTSFKPIHFFLASIYFFYLYTHYKPFLFKVICQFVNANNFIVRIYFLKDQCQVRKILFLFQKYIT